MTEQVNIVQVCRLIKWLQEGDGEEVTLNRLVLRDTLCKLVKLIDDPSKRDSFSMPLDNGVGAYLTGNEIVFHVRIDADTLSREGGATYHRMKIGSMLSEAINKFLSSFRGGATKVTENTDADARIYEYTVRIPVADSPQYSATFTDQLTGSLVTAMVNLNKAGRAALTGMTKAKYNSRGW